MSNGRAENGPCAEPRLTIDGLIEAWVFVCVRDVEQDVVHEDSACDAPVLGDLDLDVVDALSHNRPQLAAGRVRQKQRAPLGLQDVGNAAHDLPHKRAHNAFLGAGYGLLDEPLLVVVVVPQLPVQLGRRQARCDKVAKRLGQLEVCLCEAPIATVAPLVQQLHNTYHLGAESKRHAEDALGSELGPFVDSGVEPGVLVYVVDEERHS
mmetsp:Transcript_43619/g.108885  ORF Transcript_43619/g.108885 Transcript_43619/m.108885 type:complete len:208 (-) Transcript_43619:1655-2278(-)